MFNLNPVLLAVPGLRWPEDDGVVVAGAPGVLVGAFDDGAVVVLVFVPFIYILLFEYTT